MELMDRLCAERGGEWGRVDFQHELALAPWYSREVVCFWWEPSSGVRSTWAYHIREERFGHSLAKERIDLMVQ